MAETSTSWECSLRREPGLSRQGAAQGHSGSGNGNDWRQAPTAGQSHIRISRLNLFALLRRLSAGSALEPIREMRALFCIVGIVIGISGSSSSALGEVEEPSSQNVSASDYDETAPSRDIIGSLLGTYYVNTSWQIYSSRSSSNTLYNDSEFLHYNTNTTTGRGDPFGSLENLGDVSIPAAVWSLDVSTGVHLDHLSSNFSSGLGTVVGSPRRSPDFWMRLILGLWADKNTDKPSDAILSALQFQVASCGGASAEGPDLARCGISNITNQSAGDPKEPMHTNGSDATTASNNSSSAENVSNNPPTANQASQPGPVRDLSPLMPDSVNNFALPGDLMFVSLLDSGVDTFSTAGQTDQSTAPIDAPPGPDTPGSDSPGTPGSDSPGTPGSPLSGPVSPIIGDQWPVSDLPPPASPIPEASTEVMTMIGFGIMFLASRRRTKDSIKHSLVEAFCKITKKSLHHY
jgi:hypothetical protein